MAGEMHYVGMATAIFAGLWLWSWTERRRAFRLLNPKPARPANDDRLGRYLTINAGILVVAVIVATVAAYAMSH